MTASTKRPLLIGEVFVDFTVMPAGVENKLRLGGIAHAARGFWALDVPFDVAAVLPAYLEATARTYFSSLGCVNFSVAGVVDGAPNVTVIFDATEVADQGYETLLRDDKLVTLSDAQLVCDPCADALIFPGSYDLVGICERLPSDAVFHIDVAYDVADPSMLAPLAGRIETVLLSTSSALFADAADRTPQGLLAAFGECQPRSLILKENRGGSRLVSPDSGDVLYFPAQLGTTINSVGVGDVFAAACVTNQAAGRQEAGMRATYASGAYSQTTFPDLFKNYVKRDARLSAEEMLNLGGTTLPWELRADLQIYLAAHDFRDADRTAIDQALTALAYHNFKVRRPVIENGELPVGSDLAKLRSTYQADCDLLRQCELIFAIPTGRDPGTLVEVGLAIAADIPVVVFDPARENANTMVMAGAAHYSHDLDSCLNATFSLLARRSAT